MKSWDEVGSDVVDVTMTKNNWIVVYHAFVSDLIELIEDRDATFDEDEKKALHTGLVSMIRKILPILYYAVETPGEEETPLSLENKELKQELCRRTGIVIPEHYEDKAKELVLNKTALLRELRKENICGN